VHPVLIDFSDTFKIYSFGTLIVVAFLVAAFYVRRRARRELEVDPNEVFNLCFWLLFVGLAGARLLYALVNYEDFTQHKLLIFELWKGGFVWYGGLLACLLWLGWHLPRRPNLKGWELMDVLALGGCLGIFVGRWASFLSGENYGKPAPHLPWAVTFPPVKGTQAPTGVPLHPTQIYHSLHGLVLFLLVGWYLRHKPHPGRATGLFLMLYAVGRGVLEIWRGDDRGQLFGLSTSQVISIPVFLLGLVIYLNRRPREDAWAHR
jgi:phosphatidylglycerol:prolipoprotein diacylglycerol transferase